MWILNSVSICTLKTSCSTPLLLVWNIYYEYGALKICENPSEGSWLWLPMSQWHKVGCIILNLQTDQEWKSTILNVLTWGVGSIELSTTYHWVNMQQIWEIQVEVWIVPRPRLETLLLWKCIRVIPLMKHLLVWGKCAPVSWPPVLSH